MKIKKPEFWDKRYPTIFSIILWPFSFFYRIIISIKKITTNKKKFSIPIICVGNIYIGGTGKTPISIKISEMLKNERKSVKRCPGGHGFGGGVGIPAPSSHSAKDMPPPRLL